MIVTPRNNEQWCGLADFLTFHAGVVRSMDMQLIGWRAEDGRITLVVGFTGFVGRICQMHVAMAPGVHYTPRAMLWACFDYAFRVADRAMVLGVVDSANTRAMAYDKALGFKVLYTLPGMHLDGDLVLLGMTKEDCRFLDAKFKPTGRVHGRELSSSTVCHGTA